MDRTPADALPVPCTDSLTRIWLARSIAALAPALRTLAGVDLPQSELDQAADTLERVVARLQPAGNGRGAA